MGKKKESIFDTISLTHIFGVLIIIFIGLIIQKQYYLYTLKQMSTREVAMICTTDMATEFHIHPFLKINILGEKYPIPDNIGIVNGCMNSIHTHDQEDGKLHVESPVQKDFTLGDFFAVWKKEFNKNQILDYIVDDAYTLTLKVNGKAVDTYENTILREADVIEIIYRKK